MPIARPLKNTNKNYPCTNCGSNNTSIIREGGNPRLKCNVCNFAFDGSDSLAMKEAGKLPDGVPELQDQDAERTVPEPEEPSDDRETDSQLPDTNIGTIPRTPSYCFLSKKRDKVEFCTAKGLKATTLKWETAGRTYNVYELQPKKVSANVHIE